MAIQSHCRLAFCLTTLLIASASASIRCVTTAVWMTWDSDVEVSRAGGNTCHHTEQEPQNYDAVCLETIEESLEQRKLLKALREFGGYITANKPYIPNYGDRYHNGDPISTAMAELTVNQV